MLKSVIGKAHTDADPDRSVDNFTNQVKW